MSVRQVLRLEDMVHLTEIQCSPLLHIGMDHVLSEPRHKGTILQISLSFSYNSFVKFHGEKFDSYNMTVLYPDACTKHYKGTPLCNPKFESYLYCLKLSTST